MLPFRNLQAQSDGHLYRRGILVIERKLDLKLIGLSGLRRRSNSMWQESQP